MCSPFSLMSLFVSYFVKLLVCIAFSSLLIFVSGGVTFHYRCQDYGASVLTLHVLVKCGFLYCCGLNLLFICLTFFGCDIFV